MRFQGIDPVITTKTGSIPGDSSGSSDVAQGFCGSRVAVSLRPIELRPIYGFLFFLLDFPVFAIRIMSVLTRVHSAEKLWGHALRIGD